MGSTLGDGDPAVEEDDLPLTYQQRDLERLQRRIEELRSWRNAREVPITDWRLVTSGGSSHSMTIGDVWPIIEEPVLLTATINIPNDWQGSIVEIELSLGGEGLIRLSTGYQAGLNPFHHRFPVVESAQGGELLTIDAEVMPKGIMGHHIHRPAIERAMLVEPHREIRALERDLTMLRETCITLDGHEAVPFLLEAAFHSLHTLADGWPSSSDLLVSRYVHGYDDGVGAGISLEEDIDWIPEAADVRRPKRPTWSYPEADPLSPMPQEGISAATNARQTLRKAVDATREKYPPVGNLCLTGHAHIDLAWLWPLEETRRKTRRTFSTVLDLMDRYPDFTFNQSSAQVYEWMAEDDPAVFERIRQRVAEGRWEPIGGMWVESDANVPSGESFARQLIYGQRFFDQTFGIRNRTVWLPDVFGYSGGLPQIMRGAGITGFFTTKLNWSEMNAFPYDLFTWEGIDGSEVTVHTFFNPGHGYNGNIVPFDTHGTWENFRGKRRHYESLLSFGWGDGAGGPSERMLENYQRIKEYPVLPRLRMGSIEEYFAGLPAEGLPRWVGELYLELHRGTLTSQARTKQLNRQAEHRLMEAEVFGAIASLEGFEFPGEELEIAWKGLLLNQFHDILPGSSINEVYQDTHRILGESVDVAAAARDDALRSLTGTEHQTGWIIANAGIGDRPLTAFLPEVQTADIEVRDAAGTLLPSQPVDGGMLVSATGSSVPGTGWRSLAVKRGVGGSQSDVSQPASASSQASGRTVLENEILRVEIAADGTISRITDKVASRDVLSGPGNQLWVYVDRPYTYDAWDIDETYERSAWLLSEVQSIDVIEEGPLRSSVRVRRQWEDSTIEQTYRLWTGSPRLDVETTIDWHQRQMLLKARFPLAIHAHEVVYETMYGVLRRPTHRNTSWDAAKFEVSGHRFACMSEPGYGVALLNDAKYGYDALGDTLSLTLLRSPLFPDPLADEGHHHFTYSIFPFAGDLTTAGVTSEAFALNSPLIPISSDSLPADGQFVSASGLPTGLGALKPAFDGDGVVLRIYEPHGARGTARLSFARPLTSFEPVNLLEERESEPRAIATTDASTIEIGMRPFEIVSLRLRFEGM